MQLPTIYCILASHSIINECFLLIWAFNLLNCFFSSSSYFSFLKSSPFPSLSLEVSNIFISSVILSVFSWISWDYSSIFYFIILRLSWSFSKAFKLISLKSSTPQRILNFSSSVCFSMKLLKILLNCCFY